MTMLPVLSWIGNAAAVLLGKHGAVSAQAEHVGCSRQTVYDHAAKVEQAVAEAQLPGPTRADLLDQNRCLRDENQQLTLAQQQTTDTIRLDKSKRLQLAVLFWAMGLSLNQMVEIFGVLLGSTAQVPDRATLGRWVLAAARTAGLVLAVLDEHTRPLVRDLCLDEIFFRQQTVLMAVEPFSMAWLLGQRAEDRTGVTWCQALQPFSQVEFMESDQGSGLQKGLRLLIEQRHREAAEVAAVPATAVVPTTAVLPAVPATAVVPTTVLPAVPATAAAVVPTAAVVPAVAAIPAAAAVPETTTKPVPSNGLDLFHIAQAARRPLRAAWQTVQKAFTAYEAAKAALAKAQEKRPRAVGGLTRRLQTAWEQVERNWLVYEEQEKAWQRARGAFELFRPDGHLNDRVWALQEIQAACGVLKGSAWKKVRKLLNDPRTLAFLDRTQQKLATAEPRVEVREALVRLWRLQNKPSTAAFPAAVVVARALCARLAEDWEAAYMRVSDVLEHVLRASSAVECLNSIVRMHQGRHRNISQEMLDLKRLYWNCRPFRAGQRADRCPYELLGASLPIFDFWELLQMDPALLRQKLSSQRVAA
jgi:hypothetical protein